jgi:hypothetical protein
MRNKLSSVIIKDHIQKTIKLDKVQFTKLAKGIIWYYIRYGEDGGSLLVALPACV